MFLKLKQWFYIAILKRRYVIGVDVSNGRDYGCQTEGYVDSKGIVHIKKVAYFDKTWVLFKVYKK